MIVDLSVENGRLYVRTPYNPRIKDALKAVPGRWWEPEARAWTYPASASSMQNLIDALATYGAEFACHDEESAALHAQTQAIAELETVAPEDYPDIPEEAMPAFLHQRRAFWRAANAMGDTTATAASTAGGGFYLAHEMGTGKTKIAIDYIRVFGLRRVLVIAPLSVVPEWPRQAERHGLAGYALLSLDSGSVAAKAQALRARLLDQDKPLLVAINYESAWREPMGPLLLATDWDLVVLDEAHRIKEGRAKISKFAAALRPHARRRLALSGTPAANSPLDLWSQMRFVDPGVFGSSFFRFRSEYAIMGGWQGKQVVGFRNLTEMNERFYRHADRATKEEALDLPEYMDEERTIHLGRAAQRAYDDLEAELVARIAEGEIRASNALTELLRLQQLTGGAAAVEDKLFTVDESKQKDVEAILNDLPPSEPVVVFCRFRHDLAAVHAAATAAGRRSREVSGSAKELHEWQDVEAEPSVLAVQVQSGGLGIDLSRACYAIFYSLGFSLAEYEQARARLHRQGQTRAVTYLHLIARRPGGVGKMIDERVYAALKAKAKIVDAVIDGMTGGDA